MIMENIRVIFFGSTSDSVLVLDKIYTLSPEPYTLAAVVTQPPKPVGRKQIITPTPVEIWAKSHDIPVTTRDVIAPFKPDLLVSASYGEKIPAEAIQGAKYGGLNVHPSLLPRWRGGDPVPWAILSGDHQIGVTVVTLAEKFDQGAIIAQKKIPITEHDTSDPLRTKLFELGADMLADVIKKLPVHGATQKIEGLPAQAGEPYAKRFTREDGFEPWEKIIDPNESERINRKFRALHPWPGLWTLKDGKRLKILGFTHTPTIVQWEGKKPMPFPLLTH